MTDNSGQERLLAEPKPNSTAVGSRVKNQIERYRAATMARVAHKV